MVEVKFYETATARKSNEALGVFNVKITPVKVPEVSDTLKGRVDADGNDLYEVSCARRAKKVAQAVLDCKSAACDKIRSIVGPNGVLVASIVEEETKC